MNTAKSLGLAFNRLYNRYQLLKISNIPTFQINGRIVIFNRGTTIIGDGFKANSGSRFNPIGGDTVLRLVTKEGGELTIGNHVGISNSTIVCWNKIIIEDGVLIGGGCKIWDTDFHSLDSVERTRHGDRNINTDPILIKTRAFIGGGSIVLKGVTIGENSIVAAGSVVSRDIPPNEIWGGNPIKFLKLLP